MKQAKSNVALTIKTLVDSLELSRAQFARILNTNESTVSRWVSGKASPSDSDLTVIRSLQALADLGKTNSGVAQETLETILGFAGKSAGTTNVMKWGLLGSLFAATGFAGVIGAALYATMSAEKKVSRGSAKEAS